MCALGGGSLTLVEIAILPLMILLTALGGGYVLVREARDPEQKPRTVL